MRNAGLKRVVLIGELCTDCPQARGNKPSTKRERWRLGTLPPADGVPSLATALVSQRPRINYGNKGSFEKVRRCNTVKLSTRGFRSPAILQTGPLSMLVFRNCNEIPATFGRPLDWSRSP